MVEPEDRDRWAVVKFTNTHEPGLYTLFSADGAPIYFGVNAHRRESETTCLSSEELETLATSWNANVAYSSDDYLATDAQRRYGRDIWRELLAVVALLFVAEIFLQQRYSRNPAMNSFDFNGELDLSTGVVLAALAALAVGLWYRREVAQHKSPQRLAMGCRCCGRWRRPCWC